MPTSRTAVSLRLMASSLVFTTWVPETHRLAEEWQHRKVALNTIVGLVPGDEAAAPDWLIGAHL